MISRWPIRVRLTAAFTTMMALVLAGVALRTVLGFGAAFDESLDYALTDRLHAVQADPAIGGDVAPGSSGGPETLVELLNPSSGAVLSGSAALGGRSLLTPAELAAAVSTLVFEARREMPGQPAVPAGKVAAAIAEMRRIRSRLQDVELDHGVPATRDLDLGFAWAAYRWADGQSLDRVLAGAEQAGTELSGGDFVRWARQLLDLLDQLAKVADTTLAVTARTAVERVRRGVVAVAVGG
jgi:hypothetical protein